MAEKIATWKIYKTTCLINGKIYIGQTMNDDSKLRLYFGSGKKILRAIQKYRKKNFIKEILITCYTQEEANKHECDLIEQYMSYLPEIGYNILTNSYIDYKKNKELCESLKGTDYYKRRKNGIVSPEKKKIVYKELSEMFKGRVFSDETKLKMSISSKKRIRTIEERRKISIATTGSRNPNFGKKHSKESNEKNAEKQRGSKSFMARKVSAFNIETGEFVMSFGAICEAKKWIGTGNIYSCVKGKAKSAGGYKWKYND